MTIFFVDTYVVKPDKLGEFTAFLKRFEAWLKNRPELFKEAKSHKFFSHILGKWGKYVEMWEFENLADFEKCFNRVMRDKEFMTKIYLEVQTLTLPGSESTEIWNSVM